MVLPVWHEPARVVPSPSFLGEENKESIHLAVGRALNEWENFEQILAWVFGQLTESRSAAARRAYGMLMSGRARKEALDAALQEFFRHRSDPMVADFHSLFSAYEKSAQYRNNIAHGICLANISTGGRDSFHSEWFLYPPQYNSRRRSAADNEASYIYKASDIDHCHVRFTQLSAEAARLDAHLRAEYPL